MLEDYWLPRREGGKGTEITTLPAGQNLGEMDDVLYFQKKLYRSLNVPVSRLEPETGFSLGRASEISRDEIKFQNFIGRIRLKFSRIFESALEKQLVLKGVIAGEDWGVIRRDIKFDYVTDNHFSELKEIEIMRERLSTVNDVDAYLGKYFSVAWVKRNVLRQTDGEIEEMHAEMVLDTEAEQENIDKFGPPPGENGEEGAGFPEAPQDYNFTIINTDGDIMEPVIKMVGLANDDKQNAVADIFADQMNDRIADHVSAAKDVISNNLFGTELADSDADIIDDQPELDLEPEIGDEGDAQEADDSDEYEADQELIDEPADDNDED